MRSASGSWDSPPEDIWPGWPPSRQGAALTAHVLGPTGHGGFGLQVALDLRAPHLSPAEAADLMARADQRCPYSNATRGNIQVTLSVDGRSIERAAAA